MALRVGKAEWRARGVRGSCVAFIASFHLLSYLARRLLKSMSIKQGIKYDSPESAADIPAFIAFHNLNVDEIQDPVDSFSMQSIIILPFLL